MVARRGVRHEREDAARSVGNRWGVRGCPQSPQRHTVRAVPDATPVEDTSREEGGGRGGIGCHHGDDDGDGDGDGGGRGAVAASHALPPRRPRAIKRRVRRNGVSTAARQRCWSLRDPWIAEPPPRQRHRDRRTTPLARHAIVWCTAGIFP